MLTTEWRSDRLWEQWKVCSKSPVRWESPLKLSTFWKLWRTKTRLKGRSLVQEAVLLKKSTSCLRGWIKGLLVYVAVIIKTADCVNQNQSISLNWKRTRPSSRMPNFTVVLNLIYTENLLSLTELEWLLHSKRQRPQRQRPLKLIPAAKITFRKRPVNQRLTPERCIQNLISVL